MATEGRLGSCSCGCGCPTQQCACMGVTALARLGGCRPFMVWARGDWAKTGPGAFTGPEHVPSAAMGDALSAINNAFLYTNVGVSGEFLCMPETCSKVFLRREMVETRTAKGDAQTTVGTITRWEVWDAETGAMCERGASWDFSYWFLGTQYFEVGDWSWVLNADGTVTQSAGVEPGVFDTGAFLPGDTWEVTVSESGAALSYEVGDATGSKTVTLSSPRTEVDAIAYAKELLDEVPLDWCADVVWHDTSHNESTYAAPEPPTVPMVEWVVTHVWRTGVAKHVCVRKKPTEWAGRFYPLEEGSRVSEGHAEWRYWEEWISSAWPYTAQVLYHAVARRVWMSLCSDTWTPRLPFVFDLLAEEWRGAIDSTKGFWEADYAGSYVPPGPTGWVDYRRDAIDVGWQVVLNETVRCSIAPAPLISVLYFPHPARLTLIENRGLVDQDRQPVDTDEATVDRGAGE